MRMIQIKCTQSVSRDRNVKSSNKKVAEWSARFTNKRAKNKAIKHVDFYVNDVSAAEEKTITIIITKWIEHFEFILVEMSKQTNESSTWAGLPSTTRLNRNQSNRFVWRYFFPFCSSIFVATPLVGVSARHTNTHFLRSFNRKIMIMTIVDDIFKWTPKNFCTISNTQANFFVDFFHFPHTKKILATPIVSYQAL